MTKIEISEAVAEKEKLSKEYDKLLANRKELMEKYDAKMRETAGTDRYVDVIKERNSKIETIDKRLNEIQSGFRKLNKAIEAAKPKVEVKEEKDKKKKSKKDENEDDEE